MKRSYCWRYLPTIRSLISLLLLIAIFNCNGDDDDDEDDDDDDDDDDDGDIWTFIVLLALLKKRSILPFSL